MKLKDRLYIFYGCCFRLPRLGRAIKCFVHQVYNNSLFSDCNDLVAPVHGYISSTQITHGKHVTVSCNTGYSLVGDKTLVCLSGTLTGPVGSCKAGGWFVFCIYSTPKIQIVCHFNIILQDSQRMLCMEMSADNHIWNHI